MPVGLELQVREGERVSACLMDRGEGEAWHEGEEVWCYAGAQVVRAASQASELPAGDYTLALSCEDQTNPCTVDIRLECTALLKCPGYVGQQAR